MRLSILITIFCLVFASCSAVTDTGTLISYTLFREQVEKGNVKEITVAGSRISGTFLKSLEKTESAKQPGEDAESGVQQKSRGADFVTYLPSFGDAGLFPLLQKSHVVVNTRSTPSSPWKYILLYAPLAILVGIGIMLFRNTRMQQGNILSMNQNKARLYDNRGRKTVFDDVAGAYAAKMELKEIVEFLKNPALFQRLGGKAPKGALLVGPPGTGKTLLARAAAGEADVPFFSISGSDFMEMFVGVGASRVRSMFVEAKKVAPSIIFIDELDSIGRYRGLAIGGGQEEREQTLNQLLSEMDGFEPNDSVIVMAATNRPDILDPALSRPGRFDRHITVDLPSMEDRYEILKIHAQNKPLDNTIDLRKAARSTPAFSGADLENLLNEAAILAARNGKDAIGESDLQEARDKVIMGLERRNLNITERERKLLAYHEGGHAVVAALLPNADPVYKVTIIPRGKAMGATQQLPETEKYLYERDYVVDRLAVMLGGRAAEKLVFETSTSGAEDDLKQALDLVRKMVLDWGMGDNFSDVALGGRREQLLQGTTERPEYSELTAGRIDEEVKRILDESFARATTVLREHRHGLDRVAAVLVEKEEIPGSEVISLINGSNGTEIRSVAAASP